MNTPYDTGRVKIGLYYQPRQTWEPTPTEAALQRAYIAPGRFDTDGIVIVLVCGVVLACAIVGSWLGAWL